MPQASLRQPRQGRKNVAHGVSHGYGIPPSPPSPLPPVRERGAGGGVRAITPTAYAMGYVLAPAPRAEMINELPSQDTNAEPYPIYKHLNRNRSKCPRAFKNVEI